MSKEICRAVSKNKFLSFVGAFVLLVGCTPPTLKAPELPLPPTASEDSPSVLSYGMVTGRVKKNVTTQQEILDLFGGPSTMTTDKGDVEIWMYDKTASTISGSHAQSSAQEGKSEAGAMAGFFGIPLVAGFGLVKSTAQPRSAQVSQGTSTVTRSVKTITFIIKFNKNKTVQDYAVRQASY